MSRRAFEMSWPSAGAARTKADRSGTGATGAALRRATAARGLRGSGGPPSATRPNSRQHISIEAHHIAFCPLGTGVSAVGRTSFVLSTGMPTARGTVVGGTLAAGSAAGDDARRGGAGALDSSEPGQLRRPMAVATAKTIPVRTQGRWEATVRRERARPCSHMEDSLGRRCCYEQGRRRGHAVSRPICQKERPMATKTSCVVSLLRMRRPFVWVSR